MPISFIISGILLLLILFNVIVFNNYCLYIISALFLVSVMFSYFNSDTLLELIGFNWLSLISVLLIVFLFLYKLKLSLLDILPCILCSFCYCVALEKNSNLIFNHNVYFNFLLILILSLFFINDYQKQLFYSMITFLSNLILSTYFEIRNFSYSVINLNYLIDLFYLIVFLDFVSINICKIFIHKEVGYVKKDFVSLICNNVLSFRL